MSTVGFDDISETTSSSDILEEDLLLVDRVLRTIRNMAGKLDDLDKVVLVERTENIVVFGVLLPASFQMGEQFRTAYYVKTLVGANLLSYTRGNQYFVIRRRPWHTCSSNCTE